MHHLLDDQNLKVLLASLFLVAALIYLASRVAEGMKLETRYRLSLRSTFGLTLLFVIGLCSYLFSGRGYGCRVS